MKHPLLKAEKRTVLGKKVKKLRREGLMPANVYGKNLASVALQVKTVDFDKIHKAVGETGLVDLEFDGKAKPVLIKNLQMNYQSHSPLHADFFQVNLKEKIKSMIPLVLTGEPQAVTDKAGMLLQSLSEVEVEALPENLPESIEISVEQLAAVGDGVTVADLKAPQDVTILTEETQTIAKIAELVAPEPEPEEEAAAEGEEGAAAEGETAEGETPAEGGEEASTEEKPAEENNG
jgi:large subunit ribosomal protein L25